MSVPEKLIQAVRQYRHNMDNSPDVHNPEMGFVNAFDYDETCKIVGLLEDKYNNLKSEFKSALDLQSIYLQGNVDKDHKIKELENQLILEGTTNSQRCDRCHLTNFFNGEEFKCWNCGLEHTGE